VDHGIGKSAVVPAGANDHLGADEHNTDNGDRNPPGKERERHLQGIAKEDTLHRSDDQREDAGRGERSWTKTPEGGAGRDLTADIGNVRQRLPIVAHARPACSAFTLQYKAYIVVKRMQAPFRVAMYVLVETE